MSYQVIARKWRPQAFDEVTSQDHVTTPLRNAIRSDRIPHAILLTGPRGVGKTTLARIMARCLNCEKGPTETPCGTCTGCEEIAAGRSTDVQEIDAASRTSVDDMRDLIEAIRYAPSPGKYRIYVVDEVHMLSTAAFNALLKTLEEPPPRSLFIFATTNPEKIPFTVISRCQRYDLRRIPAVEVAARLRQIADADGVQISDNSLRALAREGDGSMRDAQTLLDQVIAYGGMEVADATVVEVLDLIDRHALLAICEACIDSEPAMALEACARAVSSGTDPKRLGAALVQLLRDLVVMRVAPKSDSLVEGSDDELAALRELAERADPVRLRRMFRALIKEQEDLAWAPQPYAVLEMAVVRLATMPAGDEVSRLLARLDALERQLSGAGGSGTASGGSGGAATGGGTRAAPSASGSRGGGNSSAAQPNSEPAPKTTSAPETTSTGNSAGGAPQAAQIKAEPESSSVAAEVAQLEREVAALEIQVAGQKVLGSEPDAPIAEADVQVSQPEVEVSEPHTTAPDTGPEELERVFDRLRGFAQDENRGLFASLEGGRLLSGKNDELQIQVRNDFNARRLRDRSAEFDAVCTRFFGRPTRAIVTSAGATAAASATTPVATPPVSGREQQRKSRQAALEHPAINLAIEELGAEIVSIRPLGGNR